MTEALGGPERKKDERSVDFTAQEVLDELRAPADKRIEYIGSATSHFQAEPLLYDSEGNPLLPLSDWELELRKNIGGKPSGIRVPQTAAELPRFLKHREDYIARSAELGENMFRFSLDFGRLCPQEGEFNGELMADYVKALGLIRARGMEPMLALHHFTMPKYLLEANAAGDITAGGWEHPDVANHFRFYVENAVKFLADQDRVRRALAEEGFPQDAQDKFLAEGLAQYFLSVNEPIFAAMNSYTYGVFPPYKRGRLSLTKHVLEKLVEVHDIAQGEVKSGKLAAHGEREPKIGVGHAWAYFDGVFGDIAHDVINKSPTRKFERGGEYSDFLGLHYYFRATLPFYKNRAGRFYSDHPAFGDVYPPGLYELLKKMNAEYPQKEIFVDEIGFSDKTDKRRPYWILETVRYALEAKKHGVPLKGMLLWSLVNNFEWESGMEQKFGLFAEPELRKPLRPSPPGEIRSWEAWRAVAKAITSPSPEALRELQDYYETAQKQFERATKTG